MDNPLPQVKKLCLIMLLKDGEWVGLYAGTESEIKKSFRFQFLIQNGFCVSGVYPVKGRADLVNI